MTQYSKYPRILASPFLRFGRVALRWSAALTKPMCLGVHAIVLDQEERVLLVRHTYKAGWYFPGGAVKKGETIFDAIRRELREEVQLQVQVSSEELFSMYYTVYDNRHNYVALFVLRDWEQVGSRLGSIEIFESKFFSLDQLPEEAPGSVRRRLNELSGDQTISERW